MSTPDPVPSEEEQLADARRLGLFIGLVSLSFFTLVGLAMGWRVYSMQVRKERLLQQEQEERARAAKADREAYRAAQVNSRTR